MKFKSITEKLVLYIVILGVGAISFVSYFSYRNAYKAIIERTFDQLISIRVVKKAQIENFFTDRTRDVNLLSNSEILNHVFENKGDDVIPKNLLNYLNSYQFYNKLIFIDKNKNLVYYDLHKIKNKDEFIGGNFESFGLGILFSRLINNRNVTIHDTVADDDGASVLYIGKAVRDINNELKGVVVLEISNTAINDIMYENNPSYGFGNTGDFYIVGEDYLMRSQSRFIEHSVLKTRVKTKSAIRAFNQETGADIISDYRNIPVLSAYAKLDLPGLNWVMLAEIDVSEAMKPIYAIRNQILVMAIFIALALFIFAYFISQMITAPIIRLKKASELVGKGDMDVSLKISSDDEIGALTDAFNKMTVQLKDQANKINEEQSYSMRAMFDGQDMERKRLSRELHDGLGQELIGIKYKLESIEMKSVKDKKAWIETKNFLDRTIDEVRRISNNLMPAVLDEFGIVTAIRNLCDDVSDQAGLKICFNSSGISDSLSLRTKFYIYRITQEALNNVVKHAGANTVEVLLEQVNDSIILEIKDNGKGFDTSFSHFESGSGLHNINERVKLLNGDCKINSTINTGTTVIVQLPSI